MSSIFIQILKKGAEASGVRLDRTAILSFKTYYDELIRWSKAYNLTALRNEKDIAEKLFIDSIAYHAVSSVYSVKNILDVGSGAGFPGLVLSILRPGSNVILLEPSKKKSAFLRAVIKKLSLNNAEVVDATVEEFVSGCDQSFDLITTRALFSAKELLKKTYPVQSENAILLLSKGKDYRKEIEQMKSLSKNVQSVYSIEHREFPVPFSNIVRNFIIIKRAV